MSSLLQFTCETYIISLLKFTKLKNNISLDIMRDAFHSQETRAAT